MLSQWVFAREILLCQQAADDDGLWWFKIAGSKNDIQVESSSGNCPFLIETHLISEETTSLEETIRSIKSRLQTK